MKNTFRFLGIIALVAAIGFSMVACDTGSTNAGDGLPPAGDGSITFVPGAPPERFPGVVDQAGAPVNITPAIEFTHDREFDGTGSWPIAISVIADNPGDWEIHLDGNALYVMLGTPMEAALTPASDWLDGMRAGLNPHTGSISASAGLRVLVIDGFTGAGRSVYWRAPPGNVPAEFYYEENEAFFVYASIAGTIRGVLRFYDGGRLAGTTAMNMDLRQGWNIAFWTFVVDMVSQTFSYTGISGIPGNNFRWVLD
ncbi:MAG: hypothetical protein FWC64_02170 [Treponema sp.]|nr:hypothetical protein [Treponema sp.]